MQTELLIYRNGHFDGIIHVQYSGPEEFVSIKYTLYRDSQEISNLDSTENGEPVCFENQTPSKYKATYSMKLKNGKTVTGHSMDIDVSQQNALFATPPSSPSQEMSLRGGTTYTTTSGTTF